MGRPQAAQIVPLVLPLFALGAVWFFADLSSFRSPEEVAQMLRAIGEQPFGFLYVPLGLAFGALVFLPVSVLIIGTSLTFEPRQGFIYSMSGALLGAALAYGIGRAFGSKVISGLSNPRFTQFASRLRTQTFRWTVIVRLLPVGNFTVTNLAAGSLRVPFFPYLLGNAVGLFPGVVLLTLLSGQLPQVFRSPSPRNVALLIAGVAVIVLAGWAARRKASKEGHR